jgi:hypothetical protein
LNRETKRENKQPPQRGKESSMSSIENKLTKGKAIKWFNGLDLENSNTEFSNIIKGAPVWWITFKRDRFDNDCHLLLNDQNKGILYYFFIKAGSINNPEELFLPRKNKPNTFDVRINVGDKNFKDLNAKKVQFKQYLKATIELH